MSDELLLVQPWLWEVCHNVTVISKHNPFSNSNVFNKSFILDCVMKHIRPLVWFFDIITTTVMLVAFSINANKLNYEFLWQSKLAVVHYNHQKHFSRSFLTRLLVRGRMWAGFGQGAGTSYSASSKASRMFWNRPSCTRKSCSTLEIQN